MAWSHAYLQAALLAFAAVAAVPLAMRADRLLPLTTLAAMVLMVACMHGIYFYRALTKFDYAHLARELAQRMEDDLPVVVNDEQNPKHIGFHLETVLNRPVYAGSRFGFDRYYYVALPEGARGKTGWTVELRTAAVE